MKLNKSIFGMIHLSGSNAIDRALKEVEIFENQGVDGIIVENYHGSREDVIDTLKCLNTKLLVGINILPNDFEEAYKIASAFKVDFIQLDFISGTYQKNQKIDIDKFLPLRNKYKDVSIFGGVWPKYYLPVKDSILKNDIQEAMKLCDGVVVTGSGTGRETPLEKIKLFGDYLGDFPLIIGAGLNINNIKDQMIYADGAIVGSAFKPDGNTAKMIDERLVQNFMTEINKLKNVS